MVIVTLTTTPARMCALDATLQSILRQKRRADRVIVYIPKTYRRAEFGSYTIPDVPAGIEVRVCEHDYGPATKILPAVLEFAGRDVRIVYCDDDQVYDPDWLERLVEASVRHPGECIADRGFRVAKFDARRKFKQPQFRLLKWASLGLWQPLRKFDTRREDTVDLAMGFGGVLVRPEYFTADAFHIPDVLWTVDDVWLSGQLALNGIRIRQASGRRESANSPAADLVSLFKSTIEGHDRTSANQQCVEYFRRNHGIWSSTAP